MDTKKAGVEQRQRSHVLTFLDLLFQPNRGITVNEKLMTTNSAIYAVGDCCTAYKFTHVADFMARIVVRNALFFMKDKVSARTTGGCRKLWIQWQFLVLYSGACSKSRSLTSKFGYTWVLRSSLL